jgi:putative membrane protein
MKNHEVEIPPKLDTNTKLAYERTRIAYDRTVMAWVRTATSLITFGFTLYKFFQLELRGMDHPDYLIGPRGFGLMMIFIGLLSLLFGSYEYRRDINKIREVYPDMPSRSTAGVVAALIAVLGILAMIMVIFRR